MDSNRTVYRLTNGDRNMHRCAVRSFSLGTSLTARVQLTCLLLEGGGLADAARNIAIKAAGATKGD